VKPWVGLTAALFRLAASGAPTSVESLKQPKYWRACEGARKRIRPDFNRDALRSRAGFTQGELARKMRTTRLVAARPESRRSRPDASGATSSRLNVRKTSWPADPQLYGTAPRKASLLARK
jgi:hypothetical protein